MGNQLFELMSVRTVMSLGLGPIYPCTLSCFNIVSFLCASERHVFFFFCLRRLELDLYQIQNHARAIGIDEILLFAGDYSI